MRTRERAWRVNEEALSKLGHVFDLNNEVRIAVFIFAINRSEHPHLVGVFIELGVAQETVGDESSAMNNCSVALSLKS
jgi:hypothetical protein